MLLVVNAAFSGCTTARNSQASTHSSKRTQVVIYMEILADLPSSPASGCFGYGVRGVFGVCMGSKDLFLFLVLFTVSI